MTEPYNRQEHPLRLEGGNAEHMPDKVYPINRGKAGPPPPEGSPRRLAAILAADIAGYSHLMGIDEEGTHARVKRHRRELIDPTIAEHYGKLIKNTGDGFIAMFDSPVEAVRCAIVIQQSMVGRNASLPRSQWILYRIGVNLGDVIVESDDIYGEGVNIAARLEGLANPGDVYISGGIYEQIKHKLVCGYQSLGDRRVKNITDPISVYRVLPDPAAVVQARHMRRLAAILALGITAIAIVGAMGWYFFTRQPMQLAIQVPPPTTAEPRQSAPQAAPTPTAPPVALAPQAAPTPTAPPGAPQPAPTYTAPPVALAPQAAPTSHCASCRAKAIGTASCADPHCASGGSWHRKLRRPHCASGGTTVDTDHSAWNTESAIAVRGSYVSRRAASGNNRATAAAPAGTRCGT